MTDVEKMRLRELEEEVQALKCLVTQNSGGGINPFCQDFNSVDYTNNQWITRIGYSIDQDNWVLGSEGYLDVDSLLIWSSNTNKSETDTIPRTEEDEARGFYAMPTLYLGSDFNHKHMVIHYSYKQNRTYPICAHWVGFYKKGTYYLVTDEVRWGDDNRADLSQCRGNISFRRYALKS